MTELAVINEAFIACGQALARTYARRAIESLATCNFGKGVEEIDFVAKLRPSNTGGKTDDVDVSLTALLFQNIDEKSLKFTEESSQKFLNRHIRFCSAS